MNEYAFVVVWSGNVSGIVNKAACSAEEARREIVHDALNEGRFVQSIVDADTMV